MSNKYPGGIITSGAAAGYSVFFDGSGDELNAGSNSAFAFGTGAYTVEFWTYLTVAVGASHNPCFVFNDSTNGWGIYNENGSNQLQIATRGVAGAILGSSTTLTANVWNHVVAVRSGTSSGQTSIFVNGTRIANGTDATNWTVTGPLKLGGITSSGFYLNGYMSNVRVVKGTAVYDPTQTSIRVPTQLFNITNTSLLTCNSPAIVDQSSNAFAITANGDAKVSTFTPFTGTQLVPNPNTLANTQGVWSISDAAYWMSQNKWPMPPNYPLQSLRFNSADSAYLTRTPTSTGNRQTFTWSGWVKIGKNPYSTGGYLFSSRQSGTDNFGININTSMQLVVDGAIGGTAINLITTPVYRDSSAWYHILLAVDTTQATSTNRVKLYVNGTQVTAFGTATYPTQSNTSVNLNTAIHNVSGYNNSSNYFDGYMADVNFVDGQALTPSSFGANDPNTGVWSPVPYSGTYGTNGFRLSFQDNTGTTATTLGKDWSGQGNNWTPNNFSVAAGSGNDSLTDGPTNWGIDYGNGGEVRGNYCTVNPLSLVPNAAGYNNITNGNLDTIAPTGDTAGVSNIGTFAVSTGKWYWEATYYQNTATGYNPAIGISVLNSSTGMLVYQIDGNKNNSGSTSAYGATFTTNDVIGVALNMDAGTLTFYKNGVSQGTAFTGITGQYFPFFLMNRTGTASSGWYTNFGQRPFAYTAPSGFKALNTQNLPTPAVGATSTTLADDYFNIALYTGNGTAIGSGGKAVTGIGFQPDFVWIKGRSGATDHGLYDAVRGTTKQLESNTTDAETTQSEGLTTFGSDGFTVGSLAQLNTNAATYVGWAWKANGAGVSNTSGSISSTVSANQTAGIAVVTWTNPASGSWTVGHGLGVAPKMIITKGRSGTNGWVTYHESLGNTKAVVLSSTAAADTNSAYWNNTSPTSSVFSMGSASVIGASYTMVAYCFAEIAGFSKFGSYTGNGSTDGPFVYCGFRPRFVMIKNASNVANWTIVDTSRNTYNVANARLFPSNSDAESTAANNCDILSNGFKVRNGTDTGVNTNNETYIFAVFAESPFNYSRAR